MEPLELNDEPNKAMRKMLAERWKTLPEEKQMSIRAARAKRGVKCSVCGKIGFYRENCPNQCVSPPGTPDSWASTPPGSPPKSPVGLGVLWGDRSERPPSPLRYDYNKPVDTSTSRPPAQKEQQRLRELDSKIGTFEFFAEAEEGYADSYAQMSLHQVMRRMMRLLERNLLKNAEDLEANFDTTLLHPPVQKESATFYPPELKEINEYRDYFIEKEKKKELKKQYQNQSSVRCADELDPLFRGGNLGDDFLYNVNPRAGASMHSKNTWKSILSNSDDLASSDPTMAKKEARLQALFKNQSKWIALQQKGMAQKNDRFEHMVYILKSEIKKEHEREYKGLEANKHANKATQMKLYQERLEAVDKIMTCLHSYNFTSGLDEADFLYFCFDKWKETLESKIYGKSLHLPKKYKRIDDKEGNNRLKRNATGLTDASSMDASDQSTTAVANLSGPGLDYNRMISAANPYASDMMFLQYMKKKHHKLRMKAMEPHALDSTAGDSGSVVSESSGSTMKTPILGQKTSIMSACSAIREDDSHEGSSINSFNHRAPPQTKSLSITAHGSAFTHPVEMSNNKLIRQVSFASEGSEFIYSDHSPSNNSSIAPASAQEEQRLAVRGNEEQDLLSSGASVSAESSVFDAGSTAQNQLVIRKTNSLTQPSTTFKKRLHPRVIDQIKINKAKGSFKRAGLKGHIRRGNDNDLAYLAPTLIPVPGAFQADGSNPMISHTAENILFDVKKNMILADIGYTPQTMVPLYARNTLMEKNGTTPGGDQNYLVMAKDRRYSHYVGRPLNRFEPEEPNKKMTNEFDPINEEILKDSLSNPRRQMRLMESALAKTVCKDKPRVPTKRELRVIEERDKKEEEMRKHRQERRLIHQEMEKVKGLPITRSLVRLAFKDPLPSLASLSYLDD